MNFFERIGFVKPQNVASTNPTTRKTQNSLSVTNQLLAEFTDKSRTDIKKWKQAIEMAANPTTPRWAQLQDLYDNMQYDGHLQACIEVRKAATLSQRFLIRDRKTGKEIPEKTDLLRTQWFYDLLEKILDSIFYKYSVLELVDPVSMKFELIPRRNIVIQNQQVLFEAMGEKGVYYNDPIYAKNIIEIVGHDRMGLMNNIIPQLIWKRNAQQFWSVYSERFGIPMITATTTSSRKEDIDRIDRDLKALGNSAKAVLPEGTTITIHDSATKGDPYKIFQEQINVTNNEIAKPFIGGTMVLENGSSRSQSEVHERTLDEKMAGRDRRLVEFLITGKIMPFLTQWGFKFSDSDEFVFDRSEEIPMKDHWGIVFQAMDKFEIPSDWVSNTFNFPIASRRDVPSGTSKNSTQKPKNFSEGFQ